MKDAKLDDEVTPLSLFDEIGEAVRELRAFEGKIRTPLVVHYSNGTVKPLGELLCRVGAYLRAQETPHSRVLGANGLPLLLTNRVESMHHK
jgi:hypothetical protein